MILKAVLEFVLVCKDIYMQLTELSADMAFMEFVERLWRWEDMQWYMVCNDVRAPECRNQMRKADDRNSEGVNANADAKT